jgi:hypothetical protein
MTSVLLWTAAAIALFHTVIGVDHYLPFVALGRARRWSFTTTLGVTALCGAAHVLVSALLGAILIAFGWTAERLAWFDATRGAIAAWMLIAVGAAYAAWGLLGRGHRHSSVHPARSASVWAMFVVFAFGPCETLVPLVTAPALMHRLPLTIAVVGVFGAVTIATMVAMTAALRAGLSLSPLRLAERYHHCAAGAALATTGLAIMLGL